MKGWDAFVAYYNHRRYHESLRNLNLLGPQDFRMAGIR